jgi:hypothetical protein
VAFPLGPVPVLVRCHDRSYVERDGTLVLRIDARALGIPLPVARATATAMEAAARLRRSRSRPLLTHAAIDMVTAVSRMSMRRIREELGFTPRYTVAAAMEALAAWVRGSAARPS